jgi:DNA modification methylase
MQITQRKTADLIPYVNNARTHSEQQVLQIAASIKEFGFNSPVLVDGENGIIAGHGRVLAAKKLNLDEVPTIELKHLTKTQKKAYILADNRLALNSGWDNDLLALELGELSDDGFDLDLLGFDDTELSLLDDTEQTEGLTDEDAVPDVPDEPITKLGDVWLCGNHRVMCGDSISIDAVDKLMDGKKADMVFTDPPYGMKKEKEGVLNDNLNYDDLLDFNRKWIPLSFAVTKENGSWYCWGIDEPLMDIYSAIIKPMIKSQQATFRNLITWNKSYLKNGGTFNPFGASGMDSLRSYPIADEKCLFVMCGVQGFNNNADNYFEGWEPIRKYLHEEMKKCGGTKKWKEALGNQMGGHYFTRSQWALPTEDAYKKLQAYGKDNDAFKREYDDLKREYDDLKREYYLTRAYFSNEDNSNNVWNIELQISKEEKESTGGHATPKPIELCERAIKSSSEKNNIVLDFFGGSGSTLIACEKTGRINRSMELDPKYCDVIVKRWQEFTGNQATLESTGKPYGSHT